ncbi:poly (ADP-ribose) glycohydrolase [Actinidia rufa]|uniref:poly(ADP-ribose) glycohydrolase n=1 Tax=Actinidia rufa TaxID=165716 RepID=A0A7J0E4B5_9ERIC|nr:poly (ADP-ribose) glycohydrolase [Actinidia rufa]
MEDRVDLESMLPYLPVLVRSTSLFWPSQVVEALKALSRGPHHSRVDSGEVLFLAISDLRQSLSLSHSSERLASSASDGYALFFDDLMSRAEAAKWFGDVVPRLANLILRLPFLLEAHYQNSDGSGGREGVKTGLRILESQEPGIVFLSQCLSIYRGFGSNDEAQVLWSCVLGVSMRAIVKNQENKIKCITHYFERICSCMPVGVVSFERKVLPFEHCSPCASYPKADFWSKSFTPLCSIKIYRTGLIEDQSCEALEVDFANRYLGGGALHRGCVQEEIRFMINPELIAGMLFLPSMADNEAIEIVGAERFSNYTGYASSFRFSGDIVDGKGLDSLGRRRTRIIAIDALCSPGKKQFGLDCLLREINKALCGFFDQSRSWQHQRLFQDEKLCRSQIDQDVKRPLHGAPLTTLGTNEEILGGQMIRSSEEKCSQHVDHQDQIGIATGNWGCGAFGGDPELKATIQWIAASQALRPFISYYTFGVEALDTLDQVTQWILSHEWTVGELWNMLVDYSSQRLTGETNLGFFRWLLPSLSTSDAMMLDKSMALQHSIRFQHFFSQDRVLKDFPCSSAAATHRMPNFVKLPSQAGGFRLRKLRASSRVEKLKAEDGENKGGEASSGGDGEDDDPLLMDEEERQEWRMKIRELIDMNPDVKEEVDPEERRKKMQQLLADYPLVVEEEDPEWPEDADGWGFNLGQFFNKITIKNVKKDDDENYDSDNEIETIFKDISPLIVLVHNRYKRPLENEKMRDELEKAVHIIWNCRLPSPRCVAIDAVVELDLVSALRVSVFPELIFTKAGKILYREKAIRAADELSKNNGILLLWSSQAT